MVWARVAGVAWAMMTHRSVSSMYASPAHFVTFFHLGHFIMYPGVCFMSSPMRMVLSTSHMQGDAQLPWRVLRIHPKALQR